MPATSFRRAGAGVLAFAALATGCGSDESEPTATATAAATTPSPLTGQSCQDDLTAAFVRRYFDSVANCRSETEGQEVFSARRDERLDGERGTATGVLGTGDDAFELPVTLLREDGRHQIDDVDPRAMLGELVTAAVRRSTEGEAATATTRLFGLPALSRCLQESALDEGLAGARVKLREFLSGDASKLGMQLIQEGVPRCAISEPTVARAVTDAFEEGFRKGAGTGAFATCARRAILKDLTAQQIARGLVRLPVPELERATTAARKTCRR